MTIKTPLPLHISDKYIPFYSKKVTVQLPLLKVKLIHNVFISHWGIILKNLKLVPKSAENLRGNYDQTFYWTHWRKGIEQYVVSKYGTSLPSIQFSDDNLYFSIHTPWFGYFSWLTTYMPRLLMVLEKHPNATLLVPEEWESISYVKDSLRILPSLKTKTIPRDHHVFVKNFVLAEVRPWTSVFYPEHIVRTREFYFNFLATQKTTLKPIKRMYVSRRKAARRSVVNEIEIEVMLAKHGFESVCFEDYTILEQIYLMQNTDFIISMHGAGLTNCLFMKPQSILLELTPVVDTLKQFRLPFWRMASMIDVRYFVQFCETIDQGEADIYSRNLLVDLPELNSTLQKIIK